MFELRIARLRRRLVAIAIAASVPSACNDPVHSNGALTTGEPALDGGGVSDAAGVLPGQLIQ